TTMVRASEGHQRSTGRRPGSAHRAAGLVAAMALSAACGGSQEKMAHPEPSPAPAPVRTGGAAAAPGPQDPPSSPLPPPPAPPPPPPSTSPTASPADTPAPTLICEVRGDSPMAKGANLWAEPQGAAVVASFAGQPVTLVASAFPKSASAG